MPPTAPDRWPSSRQLREGAWLTALGLAVAAAFVSPDPSALALQLAAGILFTLGAVWPGSLRGPVRGSGFVVAGVWRLLLVVVSVGALVRLALSWGFLRRTAKYQPPCRPPAR
jgi:hypothetical protein